MAWNIDWGQAQTPDFVGNAIKYRSAGLADLKERQAQTVKNQASAMYASGDAQGARRVAIDGGQYDVAANLDKFSEADRERGLAIAAGRADILASVRGMPYEQRKPALLAKKADLLKLGYQPQQIDAFDPKDEAIDGLVNEALGFKGTLERADKRRDFDAAQAELRWKHSQPDYKAVAPGGKLVPVYPIDPDTGRPTAPQGAPPAAATPSDDPAALSPPPAGGAASTAPRSVRNKNPGNLKDGPFARGLPGYVGADPDGFARFDSDASGANAAVGLLKGYGARGLNTVAGIISRWAPPSDNNPTPAYIDFVAKEVGVGANQQLDMNDPMTLSDLAMAIRQFEGGPHTASNPGAPAPAAAPPASGAQARPGDPAGTIYGDPKPDKGEVNPPAAAGLTALGGNFYQDRLGRIYQPNTAGVLTQSVGIGDAEVKKSVANITGLNNVMSAVDRYRSTVKRLGPGDFGPFGKYTGDSTKYAEAKAAATDLMMTLKGPEVYNLGVITGPDMGILEGVVQDPAKFDTMIRQGQIPAAIGQLEKSVKAKYGAEKASFKALGGMPEALPEMYTPQPAETAKPPAGARKGRNGKFYIQHPTNPGSFPEVKQAPDGDWYIEPTPGKFMKVVG